LLPACKRDETDGSDHVFVYDLVENPRTLDPQTAVDKSGGLVISSLFDGLLRMDSDGEVTSCVAMEYTVSDDLLTYTFYLRRDVFWTDRNDFHAQCTARDFVFAFRRLFNPEVKSRNAEQYFCILNSRKINLGQLPLEELGVAADGDFKLTIRLEYPDSNFPVLLTAHPAFPCNEEFYIQSAGRYGLVDETVPSNGGFFLREWVYDPHWTYENRIIVRRNKYNSESERVFPKGVNFLMDRGDSLSNFTGGDSDCVVASGDGVNNLIKKDYPYALSEISVWGVTFNMTDGPDKLRIGGNENLRRALAYATDREAVNMNPTGYRNAAAIVPDGVKIKGEFYRDLNPDSGEIPAVIPADTVKAAEYYGAASEIVDTITEYPVLIIPVVAANDTIDSFVRAITQQWQEKLSFFCKIEPLHEDEYARRLADGDYDIAVVKLSAAYNSPSAILDFFSAGNPKAADYLNQARQADSAEDIASRCFLAENEVLKSAEFIPVCFMSEYFFRSKKSEDLKYNFFTGEIEFKNAKMKN
jgi:oligopeptide transport system substrate-binding protein